MLTANFLDLFLVPLLELYYEFEESVILDIVRRLSKMKFDSAAWQVQRLSESSLLYDDILKKLAMLTGKSEAELKAVFKRAGVKSMVFEDNLYRLAGMTPTPLNLSPAMADVLAEGLRTTLGVMRNLTLSTAVSGQQAFLDAVDVAYFQVSTGSMSYNQAIREAVTAIADNGLQVIGFKGRRDQVDVAVRRAVLTGVSNTAMQLQLERAREMGTDLMAVSAHIGARNKGEGPMNHESWQGQVYSISGTSDKYKPLFETTGLGTGEGLGGYNCRHSMYPFFEGLSQNVYDQAVLDDYANKTVTYNGKEMSIYEASQVQRKYERQIKGWKRRAMALEESGLKDPDSIADLARANSKVKEWQGEMRTFINETGLQRNRVSEQIQSPRKTIGLSFLSGDSHLTTIAEARQLGLSDQGWEKNKKILVDEYLPKYKLKDDVDNTVGFWGGPEPSFNARVSGKNSDVLEMAKAWGKDYNQQAMALLLPNQNSTGGRLVWDFGRELTDQEMDLFFRNLQIVNEEFAKLNPESGDYFGITTNSSRTIEYWFSNIDAQNNAGLVITNALNKTSLPVEGRVEKGFDFRLLFKGEDY